MRANKVSYIAELDNSSVIKGYKAITSSSESFGKKAANSFTSVNKKTALLNKGLSSISKSSRGISDANKKASEMEGTFSKLLRNTTELSQSFFFISNAVKSVGQAINGLVSVGIKFEHTMHRVAALSRIDITTEGGVETLNLLSTAARNMAKVTQFTAVEAGKALEYLALAGFKVQESIDTLPSLLNLATAAGTDLGATADIITDQLTALGFAASESMKLTDAFAMTMTTSNVDLLQIGETAKYASPVFADAGYNVYDLSSAIGMLGNSAIKGSQAGTTLRTAIIRMSAQAPRAQKVLKKLDMTFVDSATGGLKDFPLALQELGEKLNNLGAAERSQAIFKIFGAEAMSGMSILLNQASGTVDEYGNTINKLMDYRDMLAAESEGATNQMASVMGMSLEAQNAVLISTIQDFKIDIYESLRPALLGITLFLTSTTTALAGAYQNLIATLSNMFTYIYGTLSPLIIEFQNLVGSLWLFDALSQAFAYLSDNSGGFLTILQELYILIYTVLITTLSAALLVINEVVLAIYTFSSSAGIFTTFFSTVGLIIESATYVLTGFLKVVGGLVSILLGDFKGGLALLGSGLLELFYGLLSISASIPAMFLELGVGIISAINQGMLSVASMIWDGLVGIFTGSKSAVEAGLAGQEESWSNYFSRLIKGAEVSANTISNTINNAVGNTTGNTDLNYDTEQMRAINEKMNSINEAANAKLIDMNKQALSNLIGQAKALTTAKAEEYKKQESGVKMQLDAAVKKYTWYAEQAANAEKAITNEKRSQAEAIRNLEREGVELSAADKEKQVYEDLTRLRLEYLDLMAQAEKETDLEVQKEIIDRAKAVAQERANISKQLRQNEDYETTAGRTVTADESRKMALEEMKRSHDMINESMAFYNVQAEKASLEVGNQTVALEAVREKMQGVAQMQVQLDTNIDFNKPIESAQMLQTMINTLSTQSIAEEFQRLSTQTNEFGSQIATSLGEVSGGEAFKFDYNIEGAQQKIDEINNKWLEHGGVITSVTDKTGNELQVYYKDIDTAWKALEDKETQYHALWVSGQGESDTALKLREEADLLHEQIQLTESLQAKREADGTDAVTKVKIETDAAKLEVDAFVADANSKLDEIKDKEIKVTTQYIEQRQAGGFIGAAKLSRGKLLPGYGGGDRIKALLEAGEFVINKKSTKLFKDLLYLINYAPNKAAELLNNVPLAFNTGGLATLDARRSVYNDFSDVGGLMPDLSGLIPQSNQQMNASLTLNIGGATAKLRTNEVDLWAFQKSLKKAGY